MFGSFTGRNDGNIFPIPVIISIHFCKLLSKYMAVNGLSGGFQNFDFAIHTINENDDVLFGFSLKF